MISKVTGKQYPSHTRDSKRTYRLKELGWTPQMFDKVWKDQNGKCVICNKVLNLSLVQNEARACADHKHEKIPIPRGILCTNCNALIGQAKENPKILWAAAWYVEQWQQTGFAEKSAKVVKITE